MTGRLIDADELKRYIDAQKGRPFIGCTIGEALKIMTDEQPTVDAQSEIDRLNRQIKSYEGTLNKVMGMIEAVKPIRCKDCKHRDPEDKKCENGHSILWQLPRDDDWYCADAERKEK